MSEKFYKVILSSGGQKHEMVLGADDAVDAQSQAINSLCQATFVTNVVYLGEQTSYFGDEALYNQIDIEEQS